MAKNPKVTLADNAQIQKRVYSAEHDALRVIPATNVETSFNLSHTEDTIVTKKQCQVIEANTLTDCQYACKLMAYSDCSVTFYLDDETSFTKGFVTSDCFDFVAIKIKASAKVAIQ